MTKNEFLDYLHGGDFRQLFLECFWSNPSTNSPYRFPVGEESFEVQEVAQKGLKVFVCRVEKIPDSSVRRLIDAKLRKLSHDYFVIFVSTAEPFHHLWSVPVKTVDKRTLVTVEYDKDDQATFLLEKMNAITFSLDEDPTIIDVANRVNAAFLVNTTDVTKKFYQSFRKQHDMFVKGIENITGKEEREWYASVMLNRLMFCYFIQKKRFLNFDENYLGNKLKETQAKKGRDKFYESFYRSFLKQLFSDGLDKPVAARSAYFTRKYGRIPYLNGGMFSMHQIEKENKDIDIPDKVFEQLFAFFDQWHWHLDNRITASGRDINPDVLGYIFEQYINDRAQMGAYYTKEDITEYIGRNTIIPWVWIKATGKADVAFGRDGSPSRPLGRAGASRPPSPIDRYIFPAMRKGLDLPLPPDIAKGVPVEPQSTLRARRANWNKPADEKYALPTEIWRETVARGQRCEEIRTMLERASNPRGSGTHAASIPRGSGTIAASAPRGSGTLAASDKALTIHDFITYNLDIRTFVEDVIRDTPDHKLVLHFYKALREVTILDPTCGSGAFLFAALNILEPLYEACLDRMEEFHAKNQNLFKDELVELAGATSVSPVTTRPPNRQYFIYKNIILRNLYGVDIMHEATEIARLRLFLKMVAVVDVDETDPNLGLDPLPDIDFNIRCGNTLVGYASEKEIEAGLINGDMFAYAELKAKIDTEMEKTSMAFDFFRREQLNLMGDRQQLVAAKEEIHKRLASIRKLLDNHLYASAGTLKKKDKWLADTQPFHWYTEFYPIMYGRGGFDVIIGNPPYVSMSKISYLKNTSTFSCSDLYGHVIRQSLNLLSENGKHGFIVMHNLAFSRDFAAVRKVLTAGKRSLWCSFYARIPSGLFSVDGGDGARVRNCIYITDNCGGSLFTTRLHRWFTEYRPVLFEAVKYTSFEKGDVFPMFNSKRQAEALLSKKGKRVDELFDGKTIELCFRGSGYNWLTVTTSPAPCYDEHNKKIPVTNLKSICVPRRFYKALILLFDGKIALSRWLTYGDEFNITLKPFNESRVCFEQITDADMASIEELYFEFERRLPDTLQFKLNCGKRIGTYNISKLWDITDKSDAIFLKYLCSNPVEVQEAIEDHISSCVISGRKDSLDD